jgi:hypothetical protein
MRARVVAVVLAVALASAGCGEPQMFTVPDLVGMVLPDAEEVADELGFELEASDASPRDRTIMSRGNWTVESQDPQAGREVEAGSTITVAVFNIRDVEDEAEPEDAAEEVEEAPEEVEEAPEEVEEAPEEVEEAPEEVQDTPAPESDVNAAIRATSAGLSVTSEDTWRGCRFDLNPGVIRSGYTTDVDLLPAGETILIEWGRLTNRDSERFNPQTLAPEALSISCDEGEEGQTGFGYYTF